MSGGGLQHLVLVGAGPRHRAVLRELGKKRPVNLRVTLISHHPKPIDANRLFGFVMGFDAQADCEVDLTPLLEASGAVLKLGQVTGLSVTDKQLTLTNEEVLPYNLLSVDADGVLDRTCTEARMPGALQRALLTQPVEVFFKLWPQFLQLTQHKPLNIAVIGDGLQAAELALAVAARLAREPETRAHRVTLVQGESAHSNVTSVTSVNPPAPPKLARAVTQALKKAQITVLYDRCVGLSDTEVQLASGMRLACDAPMVALRPNQPSWLTSQEGNTMLAANNLAAVLAARAPQPAHGLSAQFTWTSLGYRHAACTLQTRWGTAVFSGPWVWACQRWCEQVH